MERIVSNIIQDTFVNNVGIWQNKNQKQYGMLVSFSLNLDWDKEEGYRHLDVLIYAPMNYVAVMVKERWTVIPNNEIDDSGDGLKPGCDYREGETPWKLASYHDSCWRSDGIDNVIWTNREKINTLSGDIGHWYKKIEMTPELIDTFENLVKKSHSFDNSVYYKVNEGVLHF